MPGSPLNLGLIGAGRWGKVYIRTIAGLEGIQLAHLASGNPDSKSLVGSDCKVSTDWQGLIANKSVSGVIIALLFVVPVFNLIAPVVATAFMVHVYHGLHGLKPAQHSKSAPSRQGHP